MNSEPANMLSNNIIRNNLQSCNNKAAIRHPMIQIILHRNKCILLFLELNELTLLSCITKQIPYSANMMHYK